jgi:GNAT superfamily N-acetyltransferase
LTEQVLVSAPCTFTIKAITLREPGEAQQFLALSRSYFAWMDVELERTTGHSLATIAGMPRESYVRHTVDLARRLVPERASLFFMLDGNAEPAAMGGLRTLPDDAAEIVRIFTRPEYRGQGCGALMVQHLIGEAARMGHAVIRLDTGIFMRSAQKIYEAAGFVRRGPYDGAEPPAVLLPYWIYMERSTA